MPPIERRDRFQLAALWPTNGVDNYGQPTFAGPTEIRVRWNDKRRESVDALGNVIAVDATAVVNEVIQPGSLMRLGPLEDWYGTGSNDAESGLMSVVTYDETPDLKARNVRREVGLVRYKNLPPGG